MVVFFLLSVFYMFVSRSAKEAEDKIKKALDKGEVLPTEARFDSNCITPGRITIWLQELTRWSRLSNNHRVDSSKPYLIPVSAVVSLNETLKTNCLVWTWANVQLACWAAVEGAVWQPHLPSVCSWAAGATHPSSHHHYECSVSE